MKVKTPKAQALRRNDATKRSPPLSSVESLEFIFDPQNGMSVVGMLPASPGTWVQRLDRDDGLVGDPVAAVGYVVFRSFHHPEKAELFVKPVTGIGIVRGRYLLEDRS